MNFKLEMSAGEFFDLIRPAMMLLSALISTVVFASARKRGHGYLGSLAWALGTLAFPPVILPIYLVTLIVQRRTTSELPIDRPPIHYRFILPGLYLLAVVSFICLDLYHDSVSVDAHLSNAVQAKLAGDQGRAIAEYRRALTLEDNPHTHKLLALELIDAGSFTEAISELRQAEKGGEPDDLIAYRMGTLLESMGDIGQAGLEYQKFLDSKSCAQEVPDRHCVAASTRVAAIREQY